MGILAQNLNAKTDKTAVYIVSPITGVASTSSYVAVANSAMDLKGCHDYTAMYQVTETGGTHGVTAKVQMSLDGVTWFDISSTSIAADGTSTSSVGQAVSAGTSLLLYVTPCARFAQLLIEDTSGGSHGTVTVVGYGH